MFAVGDVVRLNGGDFRMTVESTDGPSVSCTWHNKRKDGVSADYDVAMLTLVSPRSTVVERERARVKAAA